MTSLIITIETRPDRVEEFIRYMAEAAHDSRSLEPGCRRFEVSQLTEKPHVFTLAELYEDEDALEAHRLTPHYKLLKQRLEENQLVVSKTVSLGEVISF